MSKLWAQLKKPEGWPTAEEQGQLLSLGYEITGPVEEAGGLSQQLKPKKLRWKTDALTAPAPQAKTTAPAASKALKKPAAQTTSKPMKKPAAQTALKAMKK